VGCGDSATLEGWKILQTKDLSVRILILKGLGRFAPARKILLPDFVASISILPNRTLSLCQTILACKRFGCMGMARLLARKVLDELDRRMNGADSPE
jgi:hypothetical protein